MPTKRNPGDFLAAAYSWALAVFFGMVLLDVVYARLLDRVAGFSARTSVYSSVSDFLLLPGGLVILLALAAIAVSWRVPPARNLLLLSLLVLAGEFVAPVFLFPVLRTDGSAPLGIGPLLRLVPMGLASLFALAGVRSLYRVGQPA